MEGFSLTFILTLHVLHICDFSLVLYGTPECVKECIFTVYLFLGPFLGFFFSVCFVLFLFVFALSYFTIIP